MKNDINVPSKSNKQKNLENNYFLLVAWRSLTKSTGSGDGSVSRRYWSGYQNVTDPKPCWMLTNSIYCQVKNYNKDYMYIKKEIKRDFEQISEGKTEDSVTRNSNDHRQRKIHRLTCAWADFCACAQVRTQTIRAQHFLQHFITVWKVDHLSF